MLNPNAPVYEPVNGQHWNSEDAPSQISLFLAGNDDGGDSGTSVLAQTRPSVLDEEEHATAVPVKTVSHRQQQPRRKVPQTEESVDIHKPTERSVTGGIRTALTPDELSEKMAAMKTKNESLMERRQKAERDELAFRTRESERAKSMIKEQGILHQHKKDESQRIQRELYDEREKHRQRKIGQSVEWDVDKEQQSSIAAASASNGQGRGRGRGRGRGGGKQVQSERKAIPPSLTDDNFPSLPENNNDGDEDVPLRWSDTPLPS